MFGIAAPRIVEWLSVVQQLSVTLTCPLHCGSSCIPWVAAGFSFGFVTCLVVLLLLFGLLHRPILLWLLSSVAPAGPAPRHPDRSLARLPGYLHGREA